MQVAVIVETSRAAGILTPVNTAALVSSTILRTARAARNGGICMRSRGGEVCERENSTFY